MSRHSLHTRVCTSYTGSVTYEIVSSAVVYGTVSVVNPVNVKQTGSLLVTLHILCTIYPSPSNRARVNAM